MYKYLLSYTDDNLFGSDGSDTTSTCDVETMIQQEIQN